MSMKNQAKKAKRINLNCKTCGTEFHIIKSDYDYKIKAGYKNFFCSEECYKNSRNRAKDIICLNCGIVFKSNRNKCCSRKCSDENRVKTGINKRNGFWLENGYRVLNTHDGNGIKEHIKIMQDFIGRELKENEVVHHINLDKLDNRIENLQIMTRSEHSSLHRKMDLEKGKDLFGRNKNKPV